MALRKTGFAQSLHCTIPISEVLLRGSAPNIFMSRAESHEVGGVGPDNEVGGGEGGGVVGRESKERGAGDGECLSLSFTVIGAVWSQRSESSCAVWKQDKTRQPLIINCPRVSNT